MKLTDSLSVVEVAPVGVGDVAVEGVLAPVVDRVVEQRGAVVYVLGVPSHQAVTEPFLWKKICQHHQCYSITMLYYSFHLVECIFTGDCGFNIIICVKVEAGHPYEHFKHGDVVLLYLDLKCPG